MKLSTVMMLFIPAVIVALLAMPLIPVYRGRVKGKKMKSAMIFNLCAFFGLCGLMVFFPVGGLIASAAAEAVPVVEAVSTGAGMGYLAAALATGLAAVGAGIAVGSAAPAAIGAFSEDPKNFGKALIFVALGEGIALYGLLVSILIINSL